jgi:hypothetical protein
MALQLGSLNASQARSSVQQLLQSLWAAGARHAGLDASAGQKNARLATPQALEALRRQCTDALGWFIRGPLDNRSCEGLARMLENALRPFDLETSFIARSRRKPPTTAQQIAADIQRTLREGNLPLPHRLPQILQGSNTLANAAKLAQELADHAGDVYRSSDQSPMNQNEAARTLNSAFSLLRVEQLVASWPLGQVSAQSLRRAAARLANATGTTVRLPVSAKVRSGPIEELEQFRTKALRAIEIFQKTLPTNGFVGSEPVDKCLRELGSTMWVIALDLKPLGRLG